MVRSSAARVVTTGTVPDNTDSYAASKSKMGLGPSSLWEASGMDLSQTPFRIYRGFVENLARSGRDPETVLDEDWDRVQARIAADIAANGTQTIFV